VERVLEILRDELSAAMQQMGAPNVSALTPEMVIKA
jgi:isopentenyl diphosphate isomerase/L-lactate dehydrogenase-like FMN-dependent dehydrogenase